MNKHKTIKKKQQKQNPQQTKTKHITLGGTK